MAGLLSYNYEVNAGGAKMRSYYQMSGEEVLQEVNGSLEPLTNEQVREHQEQYGPNELVEGKKKTILQIFLEQYKDFLVIILIIAAVASGFMGDVESAAVILIVITMNAILGTVQTIKAEQSLASLKKLSGPEAKVLRDGAVVQIPSAEVTVGDIVMLEAGDYIPADLRVIEAVNLKAQESSLTGESVPVEKNIEKIENNEVGIGDRVNMLFSSSLVTYGRGKGIVVETGMTTEVGKIAGMINDVEKQETPLQTKLNKLGKTLGIVALAICVFIFIVGLIQGKEPIGMFMTAVSLAVAAIPEGLAAVSTIVLAIGVQKMVKKNAIVKRLPAVETLGSATVICSDKTGTLTQNKMTVEKVFCDDELQDVKKVNTTEDFKKLVYNCMLCNDSRLLEDGQLAGDPTETALVDMAFKLDYEQSIYRENPRVEEVPFDSERKLMTTVNKKNGKYIVYTKGGVDELLKCCNSFLYKGEVRTSINNYAKWIRENNEKMAKDALRVLAFAYKELDHMPSKTEMKTIESDLTFIGMVGMIDPPRIEAKKAVEKCKKAGIKTVMITGDHKITAVAIAKKLGILKDESEALTGTELEKMTDEELTKNVRKYSVYARVSPEHKVRIVKAWQANGEVVAMTGDGVNDSPALKTADIGCAMGKVGTEVAKEAADVILTDDNFATIVSAVEEGRRIYNNIRNNIVFSLSSNFAEIFTIIIGLFTKTTILLPIYILFIDLVTDSIPSICLSFEKSEDGIMNKKTRGINKPLFTPFIKASIAFSAIIETMFVVLTYFISLKMYGQETAMSLALLSMVIQEIVYSLSCRNLKQSVIKQGLFSNKAMNYGLLLIILIELIVFITPVGKLISVTSINISLILVVFLINFMAIFIYELIKPLLVKCFKD